jgi:hypothetical protein
MDLDESSSFLQVKATVVPNVKTASDEDEGHYNDIS